MKFAPRLAVLVAVAALLTGCSSSPLSPTSGPTAATAPAAGSSLAAADFAAAAKMPNTVLVDVRTPEEYASGHLAGATLIDVEAADFATKVAALDPTKTYAVYCRSANRSKVAMTVMQRAGIAGVFDLAGGITSWKSAGGEVVS
ncbi:MAG: rhodanese-like domain-containing protein [Propionicimonas sp.]|uniref:rhodanese-like domain-containing protein n=1 Tax=Propionicimonas sp. TaxID=1955623 RepID=UPI001D8FAFDE|nr:rhodanese-like domain-containing protein [Propionicimonas sp.]MBU4187545.1 rhodanese-like domain-containing protein [Actinomycetota bacterium]MBU4207648.1 rhodanese-like domain-containing protein [Actinomycetota bacterium]MBU4250565.1 rhodanese-like domain-containing protein [Actinomycetota bacterium]MBU4411108.1 rhodanese-like domain-containing protein [Actinomycetota bacterium]MBU4417077.1 rhodanese-like domain-containing protein [Actinomycetota bacterium]